MSISDDPLLSGVCLSVRLKTFHIFDFSSGTTEPISTKLCRRYPDVKRIKKAPGFLKGDNHKIVKIC